MFLITFTEPIQWSLQHGLLQKVKTLKLLLKTGFEKSERTLAFLGGFTMTVKDLLTRCKDFVCFQQNDLWWRGGTFSSEKNTQHSQSYESSIDNDVFFRLFI